MLTSFPNNFSSNYICRLFFSKIKKSSGSESKQIQKKPPEVLETCSFIPKEALTQVSCCESCEIFKNTFLAEHIQATAVDRSEDYQVNINMNLA